MTKTILITGIRGLIGSNFAKWVLTHKPEYRIVGIDNGYGGLDENMISDPRVHYERVDIVTDDYLLRKVFIQYEPEYVFHFAAYAPEGLSPWIRKFIYENIVVGTANIVNNCIKSKSKIIFTSSMAVYGAGEPPFSEWDDCNPIDPYGNAKLTAERDLLMACRQFDLEIAILRPHNVYGPGQNIYDPNRNVLGIWMYKMMSHQPMLVYGDGLQRRSFTYVEDILEPIWNAAELKHSDFPINLGWTPDISIKEAAALVQKLGIEAGLNPEIVFTESRYEVKRAFTTGHRAIELLGFPVNSTPLEEGLRKMWKWVQCNYSDCTPLAKAPQREI